MLVMKNMQKQFEIELRTRKIKMTEKVKELSYCGFYCRVSSYSLVYVFVYTHFCASTCSDYYYTLIFDFPFYIRSVYCLRMNTIDNREVKLLMNLLISDY